MQQLYGKKNVLVIRKTASQMLYLTLALVMVLQSGCAVKKLYRFSAQSVTRISYDPRNCIETLDGRFKCKEVVFTVATIEPVKSK